MLRISEAGNVTKTQHNRENNNNNTKTNRENKKHNSLQTLGPFAVLSKEIFRSEKWFLWVYISINLLLLVLVLFCSLAVAVAALIALRMKDWFNFFFLVLKKLIHLVQNIYIRIISMLIKFLVFLASPLINLLLYYTNY